MGTDGTSTHRTVTTRGIVTATAMAATVLLLAGCAPGGPDGTGAGETVSSTSIDDTVAQIFGTAGLSIEDQLAQDEAWAAENEVAVAACMAAEGFEYVPFVYESGPDILTLPEYAELDDLERARQIGYGFFVQVRSDTTGAEQVNPNDAIEDAMSEAEHDEYWKALNGDNDFSVPFDELEPGTELDTGCRGGGGTPAVEEALYADPLWIELSEDISAFSTNVVEDARLVELDVAWSECAADAGLGDVRSPAEARELIRERWSPYVDVEDAPLPTAQEWDELERYEIEVAVADIGCREELDYDDEQAAVTAELESAFLAERHDTVETLVATYGTAIAELRPPVEGEGGGE